MAWTETAILQRLKKLNAPKVLAFACLLLLWNTSVDWSHQDVLFIESFAGTQAATQAVRSRFTNHATAAFDIQYSETMDINSSSGMGAALIAILRGDPSGFVHWMGVQCSTWVSTSRGSTGRSALVPEGLEDEVQCVKMANQMASRVALLCLATLAFRGTWVTEQPRSSLLHDHDRMAGLKRSTEVWRCSFWMWWYGAPTAKRTTLRSSSPSIGLFWTQKLKKFQYQQARAEMEDAPHPVKKYKDAEGRARYHGHGTSQLKLTENYTQTFGERIATLVNKLKPGCDYVTHDDELDGVSIWTSWEWGDMWDDASLREVCLYLYGAKSLKVPPRWKQVLPKEI
ncbi:unnamed protein product [Effrenium voratum]|uniref:Uncharacterized protein n=1 Tax=Effrenium voratum TaxID=2562239 RepID=A0AA36IKD3_9DINO|nr:unnamed protein product [Effrenium voratum]